MRSFAGDENNDLYIGGDGELALAVDLLAVEQCCQTAVQAQRGEMLYAMDQGMPTRETAWDKYNPVQFEAAARTIIASVPEVLGVQSFDILRRADVLDYTATILTTFGEGIVNA